jgi:hypothetical protein
MSKKFYSVKTTDGATYNFSNVVNCITFINRDNKATDDKLLVVIPDYTREIGDRYADESLTYAPVNVANIKKVQRGKEKTSIYNVYIHSTKDLVYEKYTIEVNRLDDYL